MTEDTPLEQEAEKAWHVIQAALREVFPVIAEEHKLIDPDACYHPAYKNVKMTLEGWARLNRLNNKSDPHNINAIYSHIRDFGVDFLAQKARANGVKTFNQGGAQALFDVANAFQADFDTETGKTEDLRRKNKAEVALYADIYAEILGIANEYRLLTANQKNQGGRTAS